MTFLKLGRFSIGTWEKQSDFVYFEYMRGPCRCRFLTILNLLFVLLDKECEDSGNS
jgi:hypothetical protein